MPPLAASVTFAVTACIYYCTLMPSIPGGDSGELVAEGCELGTAHPPGYPLYTLMLHMLTYLPEKVFGTMAARANMMCSLLTAAASALISHTVYVWPSFSRAGGQRLEAGSKEGKSYAVLLGSIAAGLLYSCSPLPWLYATGSEVFALNNLFAALLVYLTVKYARNPRCDAVIYAGAFVSGLGLCNQHTLILFEAPAIAWILWTQRKVMARGKFLKLSLCFFTGLLPYAYLPIIQFTAPKRGSWGEMTSLQGFWRHFRRADYGTFRLYSVSQETEGLFERLAAHLWDFTERQSLYIGPFVALYGIWLSLSRKKRTGSPGKRAKKNAGKVDNSSPIDTSTITWALVSMYAFYQVVFHTLSNMPLKTPLLFGVHARFWMQPNIILFVFLGRALTAASYPSAGIRCTLAVALIALQMGRWWESMDQSQNTFLQGYAGGILDSIPEGSLYFTNYDQQWTATRYLHVCEGRNKELPFMNLSMMTFWWFWGQRKLFPKVTFPRLYLSGRETAQYRRGESFTFTELLNANVGNFPGGIYLGGEPSDPDDYKSLYEKVPHGLLSRLHPRSRGPVDIDSWLRESRHAWDHVHANLPKLPDLEKYSEETWEWTVARDYWDHRIEHATFMLDMITSPVCEKQRVCVGSRTLLLLSEAANILEECVSRDTLNATAATWKNLGIAYSRIVQTKNDLPPNHDGYPFTSALHEHMVERGEKEGDWRGHAAIRTLDTWSQFIAMPAAKKDPGYGAILGVVEHLRGASSSSSSSSPSSSSGAAPSKTRRKANRSKKKKKKKKN